LERKQWEGHVIDGRFHLRQYLGGSAHSGVFATEYGEGAPRKAAIKLVQADSGKAYAWVLRREFAAKLSHPALLPIFEFGTCRVDDADQAYAVMELADEDLSQVIPSRPLDPGEAREVLKAVVEALTHIHEQGFVHGCLTPANIMAVGDRIKISSDGLLRIGEPSGDRWAENANDPPESGSGMTAAGDVWWLGMTLVEVLTQRAPAWDRAAANDPAVPDLLPAPFREIARSCLRTDPRSRISVAEISAALQPESRAPKTRPAAVGTASVATPAVLTAGKKRKYLAAAILLPMMATGALLTVGRFSGSSPAAESRPPVSAQAAAVAEKPADVPAAPAAGEIVPGDRDKPPGAPVPDSISTPAPAATPVAAAPVDNSAGSTAEVVSRFLPEVPPEILGTIRGSVRVSVRAKIDRAGAVVEAELDSPAGSRYFDRLAVEATRRWKFEPAGGDAASDVASTRLVRYEFLKEGCKASADGVRR
jgi:TonB family protein